MGNKNPVVLTIKKISPQIKLFKLTDFIWNLGNVITKYFCMIFTRYNQLNNPRENITNIKSNEQELRECS